MAAQTPTASVRPIKNCGQFPEDDSLVFTPKPQATSTVDHRKNKNDSLDKLQDELEVHNSGGNNKDKVGRLEDNSHDNTKDNANFLVNERDLVGSLKKQLDQAIADVRRNSYAKQSDATSCSSLGILKLDDVEDIAAGAVCDGDDDETSRVLEKLIPTKEDDCEMSWRMTRELARQSISSRKLSLLSNNSFNSFSSSYINDESINKKSTDKNYELTRDNDIKIAGIEKVENKNTSTSVIQPSWEPQSHKLNPFDGERYSTISFSNEEFIPGEKASSLLLQDQISWMKEKADIPVNNDDKSLSGIYPDDRLSHASSYLRQGSGPLGTLDGNTDVISRPNFGNDIFSPIKRNQTIKSSNGNNSSSSSYIDENDYQQHLFNQFGNNIKFYNDNTLDEIPTKELANTNNRQTFVKSIHCSESNNDDKNKSVRPNDDRLSVSSVASITHIAELLNDMSINASPRLIIDKMLSAGSRNSNVASAGKKDENVLKGRKLLDSYDKTKQNLNCIKEDNEDVVKRTSDHFKDSLSKLLEEARKCGNTLQKYDHLKHSDANISTNDDNRSRSIYGDDSISNDGDTDEDGGKENDINNESVWILPSRTSLCEDSKLLSINKSAVNDADIFKIPDTKNLISLTKKRKQNAVNKNVILLDTTNTYQLLTNKRDRNTGQFSSKKIPLINAESNEAIVDGNIDETITEYFNKKSETEENSTRYSSSNSSNVNEFLARDMLSENDDVICIDDIPNSSSSMSELLNHFNDNEVSATNKNKEIFCNIDTPLSGNNRSLVRKLLLKNYNIDDSVVCIGESHLDTINDGSYFNDKDPTLDKINETNLDVNITHQCIGTVTKCHVPLENNSRDFVKKHCLSIKTVKCDGETVPNFDDIVRLYFPEEVLLKPNDSKNVEVSLVPLVAKSIEVCLKIESLDLVNASDKNLTDITYCIMKVVGVHPQIKVETESLTISSFDGLNFGLLPEQSIKKSKVKITNEGSVSVPILLEISKLSGDILVFYMMENDEVNDSSDSSSKKEVEVLRKLIFIDPGQTVDEYVYCFTPPLSLSGKNRNSTNNLRDGVSSCKMGQVSGQFSVHLVTIEHDVLTSVPPQLAKLHLLALVGQTRILIAGNCNPLIVPAYNHKPLIVRNAGVTPVELKIHCDNPLFSITDHQILLEPEQNGIINIEFIPNNTNNSDVSLKGTLWLSVISSEIRYSVDLHGELRERITGQLCNSQTPKNLTSSSTGSNSTTPQTSRSSSPSSTSSYSRTSDLGSLELACTCSALVWASCPLSVLASSNKKSCVLRNKQNHREKLLLTISDPLSCYKIIEEKGSCVTEMRLNLECMESRQITVAFSPTQVGPCKASLIITRVQRKSRGLPTPTQKKVLHLYGYGGKAVLNIKGVFRDPELRMWTYLDSNTLQTSFTLENTGDGTAFVKLGQELVATGVTITPEECLIAAHKSVNVELTFSPTPGRADHLLQETNNLGNDCKTGDMLNITRITITHGDEATRLRLKRLYCHLINDKQQADSLLMEKLTTLNNLFPGTSISEISTLKDKMESIKTLWLEGVRENNVGVLLEKSALENAQLDSTAQFIDLATTIMDDTIYCNKLQQLIVAPRVVTLSRAQPVSSFSLRNTTVLQSIFHVEVPYPSFGLTVEPQHGTLPPHTSCLVTVKHSNVPASTPSSTAVLKIHSDLMDVIEVPVNWSNMS